MKNEDLLFIKKSFLYLQNIFIIFKINWLKYILTIYYFTLRIDSAIFTFFFFNKMKINNLKELDQLKQLKLP